MKECIQIFKNNLQTTKNNGIISKFIAHGNNSKHRKKNFADGTCNLCIYSQHKAQTIDSSPTFNIIEENERSLRMRGNDGIKIVQIISKFINSHKNKNIMMHLYSDFIYTRFHEIKLTDKNIPIVGYSSKSKELFIDIDGKELAILIERLPQNSEITIKAISSIDSGFNNTFDWSIFSAKKKVIENLPELSLSDWVHWSNVSQLAGHFERNGIYIIGIFDNKPESNLTIQKEIVYIGITKKRIFRKRLNEFYSCAMTNCTGHSGGCEFRRKFVNKELRNYTEFPIPDNTYIRLISTSFEHSKALEEAIEDFESRLIKCYADHFGDIPLCNRKH